MPSEIPQPLNEAEIAEFVTAYGERTHTVVDDLLPVIGELPESHRTGPVINFLLYTATSSGMGQHLGRLPATLAELQEDIAASYREAWGPTTKMLIVRLRDLGNYRDPGDPRITVQGFSDQTWENALSTGLDYGFFTVGEDGNTVALQSQVQQLFFPVPTN